MTRKAYIKEADVMKAIKNKNKIPVSSENWKSFKFITKFINLWHIEILWMKFWDNKPWNNGISKGRETGPYTIGFQGNQKAIKSAPKGSLEGCCPPGLRWQLENVLSKRAARKCCADSSGQRWLRKPQKKGEEMMWGPCDQRLARCVLQGNWVELV